MLFLLVAAGLAALAYLSGKGGYKVFSLIFGIGAFLSFIAFIRNPSLPTPDLPDSIPLPGGK